MATSVRIKLVRVSSLSMATTTFAHLYNNYEGDDGNERCLKSSCCGQDTTSNYAAGRDFRAAMLQTFSNGKPFQGRAIWKIGAGVIEESSFFGATTLFKISYERHNVQSSWVC